MKPIRRIKWILRVKLVRRIEDVKVRLVPLIKAGITENGNGQKSVLEVQ